ncbi:hypothetical protein HY642_01300 [Candidatus Woesearchaeota archaeon]|nr:hypothetical protein [Candidatus Woesearchaeota archaeon]
MDLLGIIAALLAVSGIWLILLLIGYVFWLRMFVDAMKQRDTQWIMLFALSFFTGLLPGVIAAVYYAEVYRPARRALG